MHLESNDRLSLDRSTLTITRNQYMMSCAVDRSVIKERLGFFEQIHSWICSLFFSNSENYWKKKDITIGERSVPMYILEKNLPGRFSSATQQRKESSHKTPGHENVRYRGTHKPNTQTSSTNKTTQPNDWLSYVRGSKDAFEKNINIYNANIKQLQKPGSTIEYQSPFNVRILFPEGSIHAGAGRLEASNSYHHLLPSFDLIDLVIDQASNNPTVRSSYKDYKQGEGIKFNKYCDACRFALDHLKKQTDSPEKKTAEELLKRCLFLAKQFEAIIPITERGEKWTLGKGRIDFIPKSYDKFTVS